MNLDLLEQIRARLPQFSKAQKRIAHYILEHYEKAAFMTAARIGSTIGVSESTVVRFAAEVGCDGYPQLQKALQEIIRNRLTSVQRMEITSDQIDRGNVISKVLSMDIERIKHTMEELDTQSFDLAVQKIIHARRIYIIGVRSAASLASFLQFYFNHIFDSVILINTSSTSEMFEQLFRISDQDVLISISFPRYSQRTLKAAKYARKGGGRHRPDRLGLLPAVFGGQHQPAGAQRHGLVCRLAGGAAERAQRPGCGGRPGKAG